MGCPMKLLAVPTAHHGKQVCSGEEKGRWYEHAHFVLPTFIRYRNDYTYLSHKIGLESQQCYISCAALDIKGKSGMRKRLSPLIVRNQHTTYWLSDRVISICTKLCSIPNQLVKESQPPSQNPHTFGNATVETVNINSQRGHDGCSWKAELSFTHGSGEIHFCVCVCVHQKYIIFLKARIRLYSKLY